MKYGISIFIMIMMGKRHPEIVDSSQTLQEKVIETLRKLVRKSLNLLCRVSCQRLNRAIWVSSVSCRINCLWKVIKKESFWELKVMILSAKLSWIHSKLLLTCLHVLISVDSFELLGSCLLSSIQELWNQESSICSSLKFKFS